MRRPRTLALVVPALVVRPVVDHVSDTQARWHAAAYSPNVSPRSWPWAARWHRAAQPSTEHTSDLVRPRAIHTMRSLVLVASRV